MSNKSNPKSENVTKWFKVLPKGIFVDLVLPLGGVFLNSLSSLSQHY
jgi:hypothetical protein